MRSAIGLMFAVALAILGGQDALAGRRQIVYNPVDFVPPTAQGLPQYRIEALIVEAGSQHGWMFRQIEPGHLEATYKRNKYVAVVDVTFDQTNWRITYKSSENLNAEGGDIHPTYNRWVRQLETDINMRLGSASH